MSYDCNIGYVHLCANNMFTPYFDRVLRGSVIDRMTGPTYADNREYYVEMSWDSSVMTISADDKFTRPVLTLDMDTQNAALQIQLNEASWYYDVTLINTFIMYVNSLVPVASMINFNGAGMPGMGPVPLFVTFSGNELVRVFNVIATIPNIVGFVHSKKAGVYKNDNLYSLPCKFTIEDVEQRREKWLRDIGSYIESGSGRGSAARSNIFDDLRALVEGIDRDGKG